MTLPRRLTAAGLGLALLAFAATPARAADDSTYYGECGFDSTRDQTTGADVWRGAIYAAVALYSPSHGNVVSATVTCEVHVNDVPQPTATASASGMGVVVVAGEIVFEARDTDAVEMCTTVDYTSDATPTDVTCVGSTVIRIPPDCGSCSYLEILVDVLSAVIATAVDPVLCEVLRGLAPGVPPVAIAPDGDVTLGDGELLWWDCPPYTYPPPDLPQPPFGPPLPTVPSGPPTGAGFNTGDAGFLALAAGSGTVSSTCGFLTANGTITVLGATTAAARATATSIRCRLEDTATGAVLYDETAVAPGSTATLLDTVAANPGRVTVCTAGTGTFGTAEVPVGLACRS